MKISTRTITATILVSLSIAAVAYFLLRDTSTVGEQGRSAGEAASTSPEPVEDAAGSSNQDAVERTERKVAEQEETAARTVELREVELEEPNVDLAAVEAGDLPGELQEIGTFEQDVFWDFSMMKNVEGRRFVVAPTTAEEAERAMKVLSDLRLPVRFRGRGHSMNGSTLTEEGEVRLWTVRLRKICFHGDDAVTVESGPAVATINDMLQEYGYQLPVASGGPPGPSVGGYISAGGFGDKSSTYGPLWSHIEEVVFVDGEGTRRVLTPNDGFFRWLFGSRGQLGLIVSARMNIEPLEEADQKALPTGCMQVPIGNELDSQDVPLLSEDVRFYWWTAMVPEARAEEGSNDMRTFRETVLPEDMAYSDYSYFIPQEEVVAPLVAPGPGHFRAIGFWLQFPASEMNPQRTELIEGIEERFGEMCREKNYRRYIQAELTNGPPAYREYWGDELYEQFRAVKSQLDPQHLFGRGDVFRYGHP